MNKSICTINNDTREAVFYDAIYDVNEINEIIKNSNVVYLESNNDSVEVVPTCVLHTKMLDENSFKEELYTIFNSEIIDLTEIYKYCHSTSPVRNPNNIQIIRTILNSINFEFEFKIPQLFSSDFDRAVMAKLGSHPDSRKISAQLKSSFTNALALHDVAVSLNKEKQNVRKGI